MTADRPPAADPAPAPDAAPAADAAPTPAPADPGWRVQHLPMLLAVSTALLLSAASVGFLVGGPSAGFGAAAGVALVSLSYSMTTLVVAWADTVRPALVLPLGVQTYVLKYALIGVILAAVASSGWSGMVPMGWGVVVGVVGWTAANAWWLTRFGPRWQDVRPAGEAQPAAETRPAEDTRPAGPARDTEPVER